MRALLCFLKNILLPHKFRERICKTSSYKTQIRHELQNVRKTVELLRKNVFQIVELFPLRRLTILAHRYYTQSMIDKLHTFNKQLRALHRRLLENERMAYEAETQQTLNPFAFLSLLMHDVRFGWLRPLSTFMSELDAFLDDVEILEAADAMRVRKEISEIMAEAKFFERYELHKSEDPQFATLHSQFVNAMDAL